MSNTNLFSALVKAQTEMGNPVKDSTNPHLRNKYASLASVLDACRLPLANNGIVVYQAASMAPDMPQHVIVTSMLVHGESGESISDSLPIPLAKNDAQGIGSAITYGRRYMLLAQLGLAPDDEDDDDGNKASGRNQAAQQPRQQQSAKPTQVDADTAALAASVNAVVTNGADFDAIPNATASDALDKARKAFHATIVDTFPKDDVDHARHWLIKRYSTKTTPNSVRSSANELAIEELRALTGALKAHRKTYQDGWIAEKTAPIVNDKQPVTA